VTGRVTDLLPDPRREGRVTVLVDGEPVGVVSLDALDRLGARVGAPADEAFRAALADADAECAVYDRALRLLAYRARSTAELRRRLVRAGAEARHIERTLERLAAAGVLDDAEFARQLARSRVATRGTSPRRLRQELRVQGVASDIADDAIDTVFADEAVDELALADRVARKRAGQLASLPPEVRRRRLYAFLARRGYSPDTVRRAVDSVLGSATT
jgi:regulatory protein